MTIKAAVHGLGNIGRHVIDCLTCASDFECLGVIRRESSLGTQALERRGIPDFASIDALIAEKGKPDVVVLCGPSRSVPDDARFYLSRGIRTVDSFDVHSDIPELVKSLDDVARQNNTGCITAAGWDPGTDSVMRTLFEAMAPVGTTFTNFGRGRSMGHSVAARAIPRCCRCDIHHYSDRRGTSFTSGLRFTETECLIRTNQERSGIRPLFQPRPA